VKKLLPRCITIMLLVLILGVFLLFSLRNIQQFNIAKIEVFFKGGQQRLPMAIQEDLSERIGTSLFAFSLGKLEKAYERHPAIQAVQIKRSLPATLRLEFTLANASALLVNNENQRSFLVVNTSLYELEPEDVILFSAIVPTIEVPLSYCEMMLKYGLDQTFFQVLALSSSLQEKTSLITRIKYDNNSSNSFGKMVLELSSYNAHIWVREPVGEAHVRSAVALVVKDQQKTLSFLSSEPKRYDLYREGLVRR